MRTPPVQSFHPWSLPFSVCQPYSLLVDGLFPTQQEMSHHFPSTSFCAQSLSCVHSLQPHALQPARHLCPWGFSRQEYWSGLLCPPGDLPNPGIKPRSPMLQAVSLPSEPPGTGYISNLVSPPLPKCASGARHYRTHSYQQKTSDPALWCHKVS